MNNLYIMIGFPGSGKSTYAKSLQATLKDAVIHSSDRIRKELYGDENEQGIPADVFKILNRRVVVDLQCGRDVIYDATNLGKERRAHILGIVSKHCPTARKIALFLDMSIADCKRANEARQRVVPDFVYEEMLGIYSYPELEEGFDQIINIKRRWIPGLSGSAAQGAQAPVSNKLRYVGVFFDRDEVYGRAAARFGDNRLPRTAQYPHVTFLFAPPGVYKYLFGRKAMFTVVGYGNDGLNEGLLVDWKDGDAELRELFDQIKVPHITLSRGEYSESLNTRYLEFEPVEPFVIEGVFGGVVNTGEGAYCQL